MSRKVLMIISIFILMLFFILAIFASIVAPVNPYEIVGSSLEKPGNNHILGTNDLGQDILSRLIYGTRATLITGFLGGMVTVILGVIIGMISGYFKGKIDEFITRAIDVEMSIPKFPLLLIIVQFLTPDIFVISIIMGILGCTSCARIIRSQVLSLSEFDFIYAVKALGANNFYIMRRHIFPLVLPLIIVKFIFAVQNYMLMGVGLGFLGLRDVSVIDWGQMINSAYNNGGFSMSMWWWLLPPGFCIAALSVSISVIGYSLERKFVSTTRYIGK